MSDVEVNPVPDAIVGAVESDKIVTFEASSVAAATVPLEKRPAVISSLSAPPPSPNPEVAAKAVFASLVNVTRITASSKT